MKNGDVTGRMLRAGRAAVTGGLVLGGVLLSGPARADRSYEMPHEICRLLGQVPLSEALLREVRKRPDFARIVDWTGKNCGGLLPLLVKVGTVPRVVAVQTDGSDGMAMPPSGGSTNPPGGHMGGGYDHYHDHDDDYGAGGWGNGFDAGGHDGGHDDGNGAGSDHNGGHSEGGYGGGNGGDSYDGDDQDHD